MVKKIKGEVSNGLCSKYDEVVFVFFHLRVLMQLKRGIRIFTWFCLFLDSAKRESRWVSQLGKWVDKAAVR